MTKLTTAAHKKIPKSQFGLPGRYAFPIPSEEKTTKLMRKTIREMECGILDKQEAKRLIKKYDKMLDESPKKTYKKWLENYHKFTASLEKLCVAHNIIKEI